MRIDVISRVSSCCKKNKYFLTNDASSKSLLFFTTMKVSTDDYMEYNFQPGEHVSEAINNKLGIILSTVELLKEKDPEKTEEYDRIIKAVKMIHGITINTEIVNIIPVKE